MCVSDQLRRCASQHHTFQPGRYFVGHDLRYRSTHRPTNQRHLLKVEMHQQCVDLAGVVGEILESSSSGLAETCHIECDDTVPPGKFRHLYVPDRLVHQHTMHKDNRCSVRFGICVMQHHLDVVARTQVVLVIGCSTSDLDT